MLRPMKAVYVCVCVGEGVHVSVRTPVLSMAARSRWQLHCKMMRQRRDGRLHAYSIRLAGACNARAKKRQHPSLPSLPPSLYVLSRRT
jgi:hypothetical protein